MSKSTKVTDLPLFTPEKQKRKPAAVTKKVPEPFKICCANPKIIPGLDLTWCVTCKSSWRIWDKDYQNVINWLGKK